MTDLHALYLQALAAPYGSDLARTTRERYEAWAESIGRPVARPSLIMDRSRTARLQELLQRGCSVGGALRLMEMRG